MTDFFGGNQKNMYFRQLLSSPRRRWQILLCCLTLLLLHLITSMLYKSASISISEMGIGQNNLGKREKETEVLEILHWASLDSAKTVSYNEVPPDSLINYEVHEIDDYSKPTTTEEEDVEQGVTFPILDNPWYSEHDHGHAGDNDPLGLTPEDFDLQWVGSCQFRAFKNVTVFSHAEFIHEYLNFRKCSRQSQDKSRSSLDQWVKSHLKASTGSRGEMVIKTSFNYPNKPELDNEDYQEAPMIIMAFSQSVKERDIIRSTWGKNLTNSNKLLFVVGQDHCEDIDNGDILQSDVNPEDSHYEFKQTLVMLAWLYEHCPRVRFVLKTTSDIFINQAKVGLLVEQEMFAANRIYGELLKRMTPDRDEDGPHHVSKEDWPWDTFPPFLKGPSYVISGDLIPRILMATSVIPTLPLPQVFFTGLVPLMAHIMRIGTKNSDNVPNV